MLTRKLQLKKNGGSFGNDFLNQIKKNPAAAGFFSLGQSIKINT